MSFLGLFIILMINFCGSTGHREQVVFISLKQMIYNRFVNKVWRMSTWKTCTNTLHREKLKKSNMKKFLYEAQGLSPTGKDKTNINKSRWNRERRRKQQRERRTEVGVRGWQKVRLSRTGKERERWIRGQAEKRRKAAIGPVGGEQMLIYAVFNAKVSLLGENRCRLVDIQ